MELKTANIAAFADAIVLNAHVMNGVKHVEIPCSLLRLDEAYQRKESGYAGRIAEQWDNHKAKDIIVSYRDSEFKVIDGANRVRAAILRGQKSVNCIIYEGLTEQDEARLFAQQDENKKFVSASEKFQAYVVAGDPAYVAMAGICKEFKVRIGGSGSARLTGVKAMIDLYNRNGATGTRWVLQLIDDVRWHDAEGAYSATILSALSNVYARSGKSAAAVGTTLRKKLKTTSPRQLIALAVFSYPNRNKKGAVTACLQEMIWK